MDTVQDTPVRKRILKLHKYDSCPVPVRKKAIDLLEHPDLVVGAGELVTLQGEIHRARKTLTEQETRYATMKRHPDLVAGSEESVTLQGDQTKSTRSIARSRRTIARKCIRESMAGWATPAPNRTINLLEHPDLVEGAGELVTLQGEIHRARETLTEQETRYATTKQKFDLALKKASEEQHHGRKTNTTA